MDVISLSKALKAKKAIKKLDERLGEGIQDIHSTVKVRLEELEKYNPGEILNKRVSAMEAHTAINLNKHNLRVAALQKQQRFQMKDLIMDDFVDDSGVDLERSTNISHDVEGNKITLAPGSLQGELVTIAESLDVMPTKIIISQAANEELHGEREIDFTAGTHINTEGAQMAGDIGVEWDSVADQVVWFASGDGGSKLSLQAKEDGTYFKSGTWESDPMAFGQVKSLYKLNGTLPEQEDVQVFTSTSEDGEVYSDYLPLNTDGTIASPSGNYLKVKIELQASGTPVERQVYDFTEAERALFQENDLLILDGSVKMKTQHILTSTPLEGWTEEGSVLTFTLDKTKFKTFEKLEVL